MAQINQAIVTLKNGMHFQGVSRDILTSEMDSRPAGENQAGPSPVELVLHALAGCTAMDVLSMLRKRKHEPEHFDILIEGTRREEHPKIYTNIKLTYRIKDPHITLNELQMAAELSMTKYCSVSAMVKKMADVTWTCEVIK